MWRGEMWQGRLARVFSPKTMGGPPMPRRGTLAMFDEYADLRSVVESHGYCVTDRDDNVVCSSKEYGEGPHGRSFWVAKRKDGWYIGTWGPRLYHLSESGRLIELCLGLLKGEGGAIARLDKETCEKFGLSEVPEDSLPDS